LPEPGHASLLLLISGAAKRNQLLFIFYTVKTVTGHNLNETKRAVPESSGLVNNH